MVISHTLRKKCYGRLYQFYTPTPNPDTALCRRVSCMIRCSWSSSQSWQCWNFLSSIRTRQCQGHPRNVCAGCPRIASLSLLIKQVWDGGSYLLIQVHVILEQPSIPGSHVLDSPIFTQQPIEVISGPVIDPSFDVGLAQCSILIGTGSRPPFTQWIHWEQFENN